MIVLRQNMYSSKITQAVYKGVKAINGKLPKAVKLSEGKVKRVAVKAAFTNSQRLPKALWNKPGHVVNKVISKTIENPVKTTAVLGGKVALLPVAPALAAVPGPGFVLGAGVGTPLQKGVNKVFPKLKGKLRSAASNYKDSKFAARLEKGRSIPEFFKFKPKKK